MAGPTGRANPDDQRRIEELRQHIQELIDEMAFYQIRWDSLAREGNADAARELQFFGEGFSELESEVMDLENQLHALEAKTTGDQEPFSLPEIKTIDRTAENQDLVILQKEELGYIEQMEEPMDEEKLKELRFKLDYIRKEITNLREHG